MRFLVTGAQGCIGAWVVKQLLDQNIPVVSLDLGTELERLELISELAASPLLERVAGRIEDTDLLTHLVRDQEITHIIHLAAVLMPFCQTQPVSGGMINVIGTLNVFQAARDAGRPVRVVYASSSAVWGPEDAYGARPLSEEDPLKPGTHYGVFKMANEGSARIFYQASGISSIGLRPWTVYGVGRDRGLTADPSLAMKAAVLGKPFQIRVSGFMDMQYVEDVAETFVKCAQSALEGAHVFNMAGDIVQMSDLVAMIERLAPESRGLLSVSGPQVPVSFHMDATALHTAVPGIAHTSLEAGVEQTLNRFEALKLTGRLTPEIG
ncbi:MAG: SDR family oxidoreductase [Bryobacterales bacterium]|nr:SDR family oxidoreductase [Bryobacterales bacterium]